MATCLNPSLEITNIDRADGNDITAQFTMRYRLESDPDIDASYTLVTTTNISMGITYYYFDISTVDPGTYVIHSYLTSAGSSSGVKGTVIVACNDPV